MMLFRENLLSKQIKPNVNGPNMCHRYFGPHSMSVLAHEVNKQNKTLLPLEGNCFSKYAL